ncbi:MAG: phosphatidate cytidylyltransferase [Terriglobia bacterium]
MARRHANPMKTRVLTGVAILVPSIYLIGWSPKWLYLGVLIVLVERCLHEYFHITRQTGAKALPILGYAGGGAICATQWASLRYSQGLEFAALVLLLVLIPSLALWKVSDLKEYLGAVSAAVFGVVYVAFTFSCLFPLRFSTLGSGLANGRQVVFFLFAVVIAGDIFAYFTGRLFGRRLMFQRVSPKKTIVGSVGGLAASLIIGWAYARWFWQTTDWKIVLPLALAVAIAGQTGDLVESALKRGAGLKDSGALLPGHGGLLDRVDSLLLGAPALWLMLEFRSLIH